MLPSPDSYILLNTYNSTYLWRSSRQTTVYFELCQGLRLWIHFVRHFEMISSTLNHFFQLQNYKQISRDHAFFNFTTCFHGSVDSIHTVISSDRSVPSRRTTLQGKIPFLGFSTCCSPRRYPRPVRRRLKNRIKRDILADCKLLHQKVWIFCFLLLCISHLVSITLAINPHKIHGNPQHSAQLCDIFLKFFNSRMRKMTSPETNLSLTFNMSASTRIWSCSF